MWSRIWNKEKWCRIRIDRHWFCNVKVTNVKVKKWWKIFRARNFKCKNKDLTLDYEQWGQRIKEIRTKKNSKILRALDNYLFNTNHKLILLIVGHKSPWCYLTALKWAHNSCALTSWGLLRIINAERTSHHLASRTFLTINWGMFNPRVGWLKTLLKRIQGYPNKSCY